MTAAADSGERDRKGGVLPERPSTEEGVIVEMGPGTEFDLIRDFLTKVNPQGRVDVGADIALSG